MNADAGRRNGPPWHAGVEPVTVEIEWPGARHRITWRAGKLTLDHHRDLAAEDAYIALGGERCPCLDVLKAWPDWASDPAVLTRWADDHAAPPPVAMQAPGPSRFMPTGGNVKELLGQLRSRYQAVQFQFGGSAHAYATSSVRSGPLRPQPSPQQRQQMLSQFEEHHRQMWRDALLWALPGELRDRLALSAVVGASRRRNANWHRWKAAVEVAVSRRAVPALEEGIRCWRGRVEAGPRSPVVESWVTAPGEPVTLYGLVDKAGGWAAASLPATWLVDVWARGLALVDGCFVLAVTSWDEHPDRLQVVAARWERRLREGSTPVIEPAVVVPLAGDGWTLRWL